jgi:protein-L-isoaspartate(D-aspartate) O-methyltransferase
MDTPCASAIQSQSGIAPETAVRDLGCNGSVVFRHEENMPLLPARSAVAFLLFHIMVSSGGCHTNWSTMNQEVRKDASEEADFARLRERMVRDQLQGRDVKDPLVLSAMLKVPRHVFVPQSIVASAYDDTALPLLLGQTISQPYIVGYMTQALEIKGTERVLEIGTGSGYQAAVLAEIVPEVYTVEIVPELAERAKAVLNSLRYRNIHFKTGDGYQGWPESAPFDRIIVTAAPDHVPQPLMNQLKPGGRMVIPVGTVDQELLVIEKGERGITRRSMIPVRFVPMTGKAQEPPKP